MIVYRSKNVSKRMKIFMLKTQSIVIISQLEYYHGHIFMWVYFWHLRFLKILVNISQYLVQQCLLYTSSMLPILWHDMFMSLLVLTPDCTTCYRLRTLISFLVIWTYFNTLHFAMHSQCQCQCQCQCHCCLKRERSQTWWR